MIPRIPGADRQGFLVQLERETKKPESGGGKFALH
jgi:hypothetical protein